MADLLLDVQGAPATPATGQALIYIDNVTKALCSKDDAGLVRELDTSINNNSVAAQAIPAASRTYIAGSAIAIPSGKLRIGTILRWKFNITKTAAGIAASTFDVAIGTNGTTGDTARLSFTKPAGTAAVDEGFVEIFVTVRGPLTGSGIVVGTFTLVHNLAATGHSLLPGVCVTVVSAAFDVTVANLICGVCLTSGAADAITIQHVQAEALNL